MQKEFVKILNKKKFGEYHDLYLKDDALLSTDIFGNFRKMCLEISQLDPQDFFHLHD